VRLLPLLLLAGCAVEAQRLESPPILVISLDTLRADRLGAYGGPAGLTPNLDRFAGEAVVFEAAYAQANETLFSHASLFTSRYPSELGRMTYDFQLAEAGPPTLAEVLGLYGYQTGAVTAGGQLTEGMGLDRGFADWSEPVDWGSLYHTIPQGLAWLDEAREADAPWFLFLHGYDTHHRYLKPTPFGLSDADPEHRGVGEEAALAPTGTARIFGDWLHPTRQLGELFDFREPRLLGSAFDARLSAAVRAPDSRALPLGSGAHGFLRGVYDGSVRYADAMFGVLMAELEARGVLEEAVIVVLSDHGESLGERGWYNHRYSLTDEDLHVPLMIRLPGGDGGRVAAPVALLDVAPTLLELAGATPLADGRGRSLLGPVDEIPSPFVFSEGAFRAVSARGPEGRLTFTGVGADSPWLAELIAMHPAESPALVGEGDVTHLQSAMVDWRRRLSPPPESATRTDPALRQELRRRGYWGME